MRPWNEKIEQRAFWDPDANLGSGAEFSKIQSVKESLQNYSGMKFEDLLRTCAEGLVMVMEAIDKQDQLPSITPTISQLECQAIENALKVYDGNKTQAAQSLGITIKTLYNKLHEFGLFEKYAIKSRTP